MLKKLVVFAITSGLAAKLYKAYTEKKANQAAAGSPAATPRNRVRPATSAGRQI